MPSASLKYSIILSGSSREEHDKETHAGGGKYAKSGLRKEQAEEYLTKLLKIMDEEKPYLDGDLTIHHLSKKQAYPAIT